MNRRVTIVPRWSGRPDSDWYPWLARTLMSRPQPAFESIRAAAMPEPDEPIIEDWVGRLAALVGDDPAELARTVLVGHSVGFQAVVRYLATLPPGVNVAGVLGVAAWWSVDDPWPSIQPWCEEPFDVAQARAAAPIAIVLVSDNDPFTPNTEANAHLWRTMLGAEVRVVQGAAHFNQGRSPAVLAALTEVFGPPERAAGQ